MINSSSNIIFIGKTLSTKGLKGHIKLLVNLENPKTLVGEVLLGLDIDSSKPYVFNSIYAIKNNTCVAAVDGILSIDDAKGITGLNLYTDKSSLKRDSKDEILNADLLNIQAFNSTVNQPIGVVTNVMNFGAGNIVEITDSQGHQFMAHMNSIDLQKNNNIYTAHIPEDMIIS